MFDDTVKYFQKCCKLHNLSKTEFVMILSYPSCKFDVHRYFCQLRSDRMGAVVIDYINTAHDAVKYCTNTPNRYKLPWIKCLFIYTFLGSILQHYDQYSLYFSLKHSIDPIWADETGDPNQGKVYKREYQHYGN